MKFNIHIFSKNITSSNSAFGKILYVMKNLIIILIFLLPVGLYSQLRGQLGILKTQANSGINPATGSAWVVGDKYRLIFVSSTSRNATSTSISDYNSHVQSAANAAGLGAVNWYAIGSTSTVSARSNTKTTNSDTDGGIFLMDGSQVVANNLADLWDGTIDTRIDINEKGSPNSVNTSIWTNWTAVWTGTANNGTIDATRFLGASTVTLGLAEAELKFWVNRSTHNMNTVNLPLYGISEVLTVEKVLPINLSYFETSLLDSKKVKITWQTESENNNNYFSVERSIDGIKWNELTRVNGAGNSLSSLKYTAFDNNPFTGISYYRLKQTDFDGQFEYSKISSIGFENSSLMLYPNPTTNHITILDGQIKLEGFKLYNNLGQDVTSLIKIIEQSDRSTIIDLSNLNLGTYWLKTNTATTKIYKQ